MGMRGMVGREFRYFTWQLGMLNAGKIALSC